jgi:cytochrome P450
MNRLHEFALKSIAINIVDWFNFTMFDITSQLTFGETFGCLAQSKYHPWVARVFPGMKLIAWSGVIAKIPGLGTAIQWVLPKRLVEEANTHIQMVVKSTDKRISAIPNRPDFMSYILRHNNGQWEASLSKDELYLDSQLLVIAGSETTATLLSGAIYYLSRNLDAMACLKDTLRSTFQFENEITPAAVSRIPYVVAVINECLRLYPPGAINMPRTVPPGGAIIDERYVPAGTVVGIAQFAAYRSPLHFTQPLDFIPERWEADGVYANDNKDIFQPFSYGPRNCIGRNLAILEIRYILARLVWKFDLEVLPSQEHWPTKQKTYLSWVKPPLMLRLKHAC